MACTKPASPAVSGTCSRSISVSVKPGQMQAVWTGALAAARSWQVARISPTIACFAVTYEAVLATAFSAARHGSTLSPAAQQ